MKGIEQGFASLLADLEHEDDRVRKAAVWNLGILRSPAAVEPLVTCLADTSSGVRRAAIYALGDIKAPRCFGSLLACLKDDNEEVREAAAWALSQLAMLECVEPLFDCLGDEFAKVRRAALKALSEIQDDYLDRKLLSLCYDGEGFWWDPFEIIDDFRVVEAAATLNLEIEEVRGRYESLAIRYRLSLSWLP
ncbi:MAG: HEAT repeat domain-containing protein [Thermodesulfobacteriota bacterium]